MKVFKKLYINSDKRNEDLNNLLKLGYIITAVYGDGVKVPLTMEYKMETIDEDK